MQRQRAAMALKSRPVPSNRRLCVPDILARTSSEYSSARRSGGDCELVIGQKEVEWTYLVVRLNSPRGEFLRNACAVTTSVSSSCYD